MLFRSIHHWLVSDAQDNTLVASSKRITGMKYFGNLDVAMGVLTPAGLGAAQTGVAVSGARPR